MAGYADRGSLSGLWLSCLFALAVRSPLSSCACVLRVCACAQLRCRHMVPCTQHSLWSEALPSTHADDIHHAPWMHKEHIHTQHTQHTHTSVGQQCRHEDNVAGLFAPDASKGALLEGPLLQRGGAALGDGGVNHLRLVGLVLGFFRLVTSVLALAAGTCFWSGGGMTFATTVPLASKALNIGKVRVQQQR